MSGVEQNATGNSRGTGFVYRDESGESGERLPEVNLNEGDSAEGDGGAALNNGRVGDGEDQEVETSSAQIQRELKEFGTAFLTEVRNLNTQLAIYQQELQEHRTRVAALENGQNNQNVGQSSIVVPNPLPSLVLFRDSPDFNPNFNSNNSSTQPVLPNSSQQPPAHASSGSTSNSNSSSNNSSSNSRTSANVGQGSVPHSGLNNSNSRRNANGLLGSIPNPFSNPGNSSNHSCSVPHSNLQTKDQRITSFKKRIGIFDPNIDRPEHWVRRYEHFIREYGLDLAIGIDELFRFMTHKDVSNWFITEGSNCRSRYFDDPSKAPEIWADFSRSLIQYFGPNTTKEIALAKLKTFRLQPSMTADSFYMELRGLYSKAYQNFSESDIVRHAREHLPESIKLEFIGVDGDSQQSFLRKLRNLIAENRVVYDAVSSSSSSSSVFSSVTANAAHRNHNSSNNNTRNSVVTADPRSNYQAEQLKCDYCGLTRHTVDRCFKKAADLLRERDERSGNSRNNNGQNNNNGRGGFRGRASFRGRGRGGRSYGRGNYNNNHNNYRSDSRRDDSHPRGNNNNNHHQSDNSNNNNRHSSAMGTDDFRNAFAASLAQLVASNNQNGSDNGNSTNNTSSNQSCSQNSRNGNNNSGK